MKKKKELRKKFDFKLKEESNVYRKEGMKEERRKE